VNCKNLFHAGGLDGEEINYQGNDTSPFPHHVLITKKQVARFENKMV
jgi:hypothetical protein